MSEREQIDEGYGTYRGIGYVYTVYYVPATEYTPDQRRVVVRPTLHTRPIDQVGQDESLEPSSILPWRNPDPVSKERHVNRAVSAFQGNIDRYYEAREKAQQ
mgnify:CR=1 FL=1